MVSVTLQRESVAADWPSVFLRGTDCFAPLSMEISADADASSFTGKEGHEMLTFGEFIAVLSLCIASISFGYRLGRDKSSDESNKKQE